MALMDFATRMFGYNPFDTNNSGQPLQLPGATMANTSTIAEPTLGQMYQDDLRQAQFDRLGNLGMLLLASSQQLTPAQRATILAQAPQYMDGAQRDAMTAAQARLMNMQGKATQDEMTRADALRQRFNDPNFVKSLGLSQDQAQALGPAGIQKLLENQAMANTPENILDRQYKQAQIDHLLNPPKTQVTPQMVDLPGGGKGWATPGSAEVMPIGGAGKGTAEEPKKTAEEVKGNQFALQSIDAYKKLADPEYQYALTSRSQQLANNIPYFSSPWSSNDYRSADAASSAMTDAILRNKSGATINDPEIQDEIRRVIPQPGDTPEQLRDKVARQRFIIEGFIGASSPADRKGLRELFDKTNNDLMSKYTRQGPTENNSSASIPGVKSIRQIQ
jgi:hypothetical protein